MKFIETKTGIINEQEATNKLVLLSCSEFCFTISASISIYVFCQTISILSLVTCSSKLTSNSSPPKYRNFSAIEVYEKVEEMAKGEDEKEDDDADILI
jgi:hypothetical protein